MRRWGIEWVWVLGQQRHKARRYLIGNPKFLVRALRDALTLPRSGLR
jgi:N-acetylglucosaminyldiphosphoundecaprenol N-acetyl-beta-D-mannosaminyltransferase